MKIKLVIFITVFCFDPLYGMKDIVVDFPVYETPTVDLSDTRELLNYTHDWKQVIATAPEIKATPLPMIERPGVCYDWAMKSLLRSYGITKKIETPVCYQWFALLPEFFENVEKPEKNDLAVYFCKEKKAAPKHFGLVNNPESLIIDSKWGTIKAIFTHSLFLLPAIWGNTVGFFRLKKEYHTPGKEQKRFIKTMRTVLMDDFEMQQTLQNKINRFWELIQLNAKKTSESKQEIVGLLEQFSSISVNCSNQYGRTPLMIAVINDNPVLVELLLQYGADQKAEDIDGKTAYMFAKRKNNPILLKLLGDESYFS